MKKIFVYADGQAKNSNTLGYIEKLLTAVREKSQGQIEYEIYTPHNTNIKSCKGCCACFKIGKCVIKDDDMDMLKEKMISSDYIILASPVFLHNVTGNVKTFIDRLSYWCHIFKLAGKPGAVISSAYSNGTAEVSEYLKKVFGYLGVSVTQDIHVLTIFNENENIFIKKVEEIHKSTMGLTNAPITKDLEMKFLALKFQVRGSKDNGYEYNYWLENGLLESESLEEYIKSKNTVSMKS